MCRGESTRTAGGGTIAVLKCTTGIKPDVNLFLSASGTETIASLQSHSPELTRCPSCFDVQIHRDGDLRSKHDTASMMHAFTLPRDRADHTQLPFNLDLGVGGEGVIGRRVSMVHQDSNGHTVVRQGIIGWN